MCFYGPTAQVFACLINVAWLSCKNLLIEQLCFSSRFFDPLLEEGAFKGHIGFDCFPKRVKRRLPRGVHKAKEAGLQELHTCHNDVLDLGPAGVGHFFQEVLR